MQRSSLFALAFLAAMALPTITYAEPPPSVSELSAQPGQDGSILVSWQLGGEDTKSYRVYYSQKSILENEGYYDDVETTEGPVASIVLQSVPAAWPTVYVAVMAVNGEGEESAFFAEEVKMERAPSVPETELAPPPPPLESDSAPSTPAEPNPLAEPDVPLAPLPPAALRLLSAEALSATSVRLTFSHEPRIEPSLAPQAFAVEDGTGHPLSIEQLTIEGPTVTVQTVRQTAGTVYRVILSEPLTGEGDLPLDPIDRTAFFTGHATGLVASELPAQMPQPPTAQQAFALPDIVNFTLTATPQSNKLFTIIGQWEYDPSTPEDAFLVVRQSRDGGRTFGPSEYLPRTMDGVRIPDVTPESFGLSVTVADASGESSPGVLKSVFAWNAPVIAPPIAPIAQPTASTVNVAAPKALLTPPQTPKAKNLSQTGVGTMSTLALLGAAMGWKRARRAKARS